MENADLDLRSFVSKQNARKTLFTAGPASLLPENLTGLQPCFGRGDLEYLDAENFVLDTLKRMSGHSNIARLQGSGSLALEICALNFLSGNILVVSTGYYSDRLNMLAEQAKITNEKVGLVHYLTLEEAQQSNQRFDWIWACSTETSVGLKTPIKVLKELANDKKSRLMLDATASFGLEDDHEYADVISYSSCKGLFGLTGACFIAFNEPPDNFHKSFYLSLDTHLHKKVTGPYHAVLSLLDVLPKHKIFKKNVVTNKQMFLERMKEHLTQPIDSQPLLCTHVSVKIQPLDPNVILYQPRSNIGGSVICHIGDVHSLGDEVGKILEKIKV